MFDTVVADPPWASGSDGGSLATEAEWQQWWDSAWREPPEAPAWLALEEPEDAPPTDPVVTDWAVPGVPRAAVSRSGVAGSIERLQAAVTGCVQDAGLGAGVLVDAAALLRLAEAVQALALRELAAVERAASYRHAEPALDTHGHLSAAGWLHEALLVEQSTGRSRVRLATRIAPGGDLEPLGALLLAGRTTLAHVRAVATGVRGLDPQVIAGSLDALCTLVQTADPVTVARELRERAHAVSEELARDAERRQRERRGFSFARLTGGTGSGRLLLDGLSAAVVEEALVRTMTRQRTALTDAGEPDTRDALQRRADALVALCAHALGCDTVDTGDGLPGPLVGAGGVRAALTIVVPGERLTSQPPGNGSADAAASSASASGCDRPATDGLLSPDFLPAARLVGADSGHPVLLSHATLLRLTCDADISRIVLSGDSQVLDAGRTTRTVTPAQWRALVVRDGGCVTAGCHQGPSQCQAHHLQHWSRGGPSDLDNYVLLCHQHHHQLHDETELWLRHHDGRWLTPDGPAPPDTPPPTPTRRHQQARTRLARP